MSLLKGISSTLTQNGHVAALPSQRKYAHSRVEVQNYEGLEAQQTFSNVRRACQTAEAHASVPVTYEACMYT